MRSIVVAVVLSMLGAVAYAQPAPAVNAFDRISSTLGKLIIENEQKTDLITQLQTQLRDLTLAKAEAERKLAEATKVKE